MGTAPAYMHFAGLPRSEELVEALRRLLIAGIVATIIGVVATLSMALGILIALELPASAGWAIGLLVGVELLFAGLALIALARAPLARRRLAARSSPDRALTDTPCDACRRP